MAYFAPHIDAAGIHLPTYTDVRDDLISLMRTIYGEDIYLEADSQDYEQISIFADKIHDTYAAAKLAYNNRSPATALGAGLAGLVKLNGISKKGKGYSTAAVRLSGAPDTVITNGIVQDKKKRLWTIHDEVIIGESGTVVSVATCNEAGALAAEIGDIDKVVSSITGWHGVENIAAATPGRMVEVDPELRARQTISVARPSRTVLLGTHGAIAELDGVTRDRVYENDTNVPDEHGIPGHHISAVVEGGDDMEIATAIHLHKTPGTGTYGDVALAVNEDMQADPVEYKPISFFRPRYIDVHVNVKVTPKAGFVNQLPTDITYSIAEYLSSLEIGTNLVCSALYTAAYAATPDIKNPVFSVKEIAIGRAPGALATDDIEIAFNEVTRGILSNITVEVVT